MDVFSQNHVQFQRLSPTSCRSLQRVLLEKTRAQPFRKAVKQNILSGRRIQVAPLERAHRAIECAKNPPLYHRRVVSCTSSSTCPHPPPEPYTPLLRPSFDSSTHPLADADRNHAPCHSNPSGEKENVIQTNRLGDCQNAAVRPWSAISRAVSSTTE